MAKLGSSVRFARAAKRVAILSVMFATRRELG
jgi:hypothetical protein